jgi:hypothetical protein
MEWRTAIMYNANTNRYTASEIVERALDVADIQNTDFLSYREKTKYLNDAWRNVYQTIINYNLDVFTVRAQLVGNGGVYPLPFDCYQIKAVKNPITGSLIPRKAESESVLGPYYEIVNNTLILGPNIGPVEVVYWRKPFFLSLPDKQIETNIEENRAVLDSCNNSILLKDTAVGVEQKMYVQNLLSDSTLELPYAPDPEYDWYLGNNFILKCNSSTVQAYDFYGNLLDEITNIDYIYHLAKADNGLYYFTKGNEEDESIEEIYELFGDKIAEVKTNENTQNIIGIDGNFYPVNVGNVFPIGIFDDRPAYITGNKELHLINPNGSEIVEKVNVPSIGAVRLVKYGFLTFDGTLYSCIPDTELNFPNNIYYDCIAYDLAIRFLCKQNADSSGVEALNTNAWNQLTNSIDMSSDFQRVKLVRRR